MRNLTVEELILVNKYAQGLIEKEEIFDWFLSFNSEDRPKIVLDIWDLALQARVKEDDVDNAVENAGLKSTHNPSVMLKTSKEPFKNRGYNLVKLKDKVLFQAFKVILESLVIADSRRRSTECLNGCDHWWHEDLSNPMVVKHIRKNNGMI